MTGLVRPGSPCGGFRIRRTASARLCLIGAGRAAHLSRLVATGSGLLRLLRNSGLRGDAFSRVTRFPSFLAGWIGGSGGTLARIRTLRRLAARLPRLADRPGLSLSRIALSFSHRLLRSLRGSLLGGHDSGHLIDVVREPFQPLSCLGTALAQPLGRLLTRFREFGIGRCNTIRRRLQILRQRIARLLGRVRRFGRRRPDHVRRGGIIPGPDSIGRRLRDWVILQRFPEHAQILAGLQRRLGLLLQVGGRGCRLFRCGRKGIVRNLGIGQAFTCRNETRNRRVGNGRQRSVRHVREQSRQQGHGNHQQRDHLADGKVDRAGKLGYHFAKRVRSIRKLKPWHHRPVRGHRRPPVIGGSQAFMEPERPIEHHRDGRRRDPVQHPVGHTRTQPNADQDRNRDQRRQPGKSGQCQQDPSGDDQQTEPEAADD